MCQLWTFNTSKDNGQNLQVVLLDHAPFEGLKHKNGPNSPPFLYPQSLQQYFSGWFYLRVHSTSIPLNMDLLWVNKITVVWASKDLAYFYFPTWHPYHHYQVNENNLKDKIVMQLNLFLKVALTWNITVLTVLTETLSSSFKFWKWLTFRST